MDIILILPHRLPKDSPAQPAYKEVTEKQGRLVYCARDIYNTKVVNRVMAEVSVCIYVCIGSDRVVMIKIEY